MIEDYSPLKRHREKRAFGEALKTIYETEAGKVFFQTFFRHCGVTRPKFATEAMDINWNESRRHLAMSYLRILSEDDVESYLKHMEAEQNIKKADKI